MKTTSTTNATADRGTYRHLEPSTQVFSREDGEAGRIVRVSTYRRNGIGAWSYLVDTAHGREIWDASDCQPIA